jgi:hypothetical protein
MVIFVPLVVVESRGATVVVTIDQNSVRLNMSLELVENLTSLPAVSFLLDASNSTPVLQTLRAAVQNMTHGSHVELLRVRVSSTRLDLATNTWRLQENLTLVVGGVNSNLGGTVRSDLAFLSVSVPGSIMVAGLEINKAGATYLLQPLLNTSITGTSFFVNGGVFTNTLIAGRLTSGFDILDLSWVPPVSQWTSQNEPLGSSTVWSLGPVTPYNVTIGLGKTPENTFVQRKVAVYDPSLELVAPPRAWAQGTTVFFDLPTLSELVMPTIVVVTLVAGIAGYFLDRRLTKRVTGARRKR